MVKIRIDKGERYPTFDIVDDPRWRCDAVIELTREEFAFVRQALDDYDEAQAILERAFDRAKAAEKAPVGK